MAQSNGAKADSASAKTDRPILIVDDDSDLLDILSSYLGARDYRVVTARNGEEALAAVEREHPSLILLDIMMPQMDGWEVARIVRDHPEWGELRIVMLTARGEFEDKQEGLRSGADDYLVKPVGLEELGESVERNLKVLQNKT